jgi:hypothetical protein
LDEVQELIPHIIISHYSLNDKSPIIQPTEREFSKIT